MAEEFQVNVRGIEETCAALSNMPANIVKGAYAKALAAAAVPIVRELRTRAPKDTGAMVAHLMTDIAVDTQGKGGTASIGFGRYGFRARMIEYGHRIVGHKPNKKDTGKVVAPKPFMRESVAAAGEESIEKFAESLRDSVDAGLPGVKVA